MKSAVGLILLLLLFGCAHMHVHKPFCDVNTMLTVAGKTNAPLGSAKAVVIAYRQTPGQEDGLAQPMTPKLFIMNFDGLRTAKFVDKGVWFGAHSVGGVYCRERILIYRSGYEPAWLEKKLIRKEYRYPTALALIPCDPVRSRRLLFDAVSHVFRAESESVRQAVLKKLALNLD